MCLKIIIAITMLKEVEKFGASFVCTSLIKFLYFPEISVYSHCF